MPRLPTKAHVPAGRPMQLVSQQDGTYFDDLLEQAIIPGVKDEDVLEAIGAFETATASKELNERGVVASKAKRSERPAPAPTDAPPAAIATAAEQPTTRAALLLLDNDVQGQAEVPIDVDEDVSSEHLGLNELALRNIPDSFNFKPTDASENSGHVEVPNDADKDASEHPHADQPVCHLQSTDGGLRQMQQHEPLVDSQGGRPSSQTLKMVDDELAELDKRLTQLSNATGISTTGIMKRWNTTKSRGGGLWNTYRGYFTAHKDDELMRIGLDPSTAITGKIRANAYVGVHTDGFHIR
ncbi:hypothetical protein AX14_004954 [Amanita brunnescens Koide BX004]|nr:hypothetical protein AX14_004954 [Amanita brunnescens Koide BX004]